MVPYWGWAFVYNKSGSALTGSALGVTWGGKKKEIMKIKDDIPGPQVGLPVARHILYIFAWQAPIGLPFPVWFAWHCFS
jgi:hypothetical protein